MVLHCVITYNYNIFSINLHLLELSKYKLFYFFVYKIHENREIWDQNALTVKNFKSILNIKSCFEIILRQKKQHKENEISKILQVKQTILGHFAIKN